jgi:hypothetical protein
MDGLQVMLDGAVARLAAYIDAANRQEATE